MENQTALANRPVEREGQAGDNGDNSSEETAVLVWRKFRERLRQVEAEARKLRDSNEAKDKRIMELESKVRDSSPFALHGHSLTHPVSAVRDDPVLSPGLMIRVSSPGDTNTNIDSGGGGGGNALVRM
ncbi:hypothetical protein FQN53_001434 [Emmonsiellopsis sp. PD_33]|nr:hypothetical protein FQN53_001434 [Emmonsiellopsis sp. PD_33]